MATRHRLCESAARCLAAIERYEEGGRSAAAWARMEAEVEVVIGYLMELGLSSGTAEAEVVMPVGRQLLDQYGWKDGYGLYAEFVGVFVGAGMPLIYGGVRFILPCWAN